jgi:DegV family protein with EDD domain
MTKIAILTDSCCDLPKDIVAELGIFVIPIELKISGKIYKDTEKAPEEFYRMMNNSEDIPRHIPISADTFKQYYSKLYANGYTDIICVSMSSVASKTYANSVTATKSFFAENKEANGKLRIFNLDSRCYSLFYGYPVMKAAKKARRGASAEALVAYIKDWFNVGGGYVVPYSLRFARRSGSIDETRAFAGELLGMRPIIEFADGNAVTAEKIRGVKNIVPKLLEHVEKKMTPQTPYVLVYGSEVAPIKEIERELTKHSGRKPEMIAKIGGVTASSIGPDLVGIMIRRKTEI